jgi:hypothetical protein
MLLLELEQVLERNQAQVCQPTQQHQQQQQQQRQLHKRVPRNDTTAFRANM